MSSGGGVNRLRELQEHIGYRFRDQRLLTEALTHESARSAHAGNGRALAQGPSNERLEFLGDRVLALIVAELLMWRFPNEPEGHLTHRLIDLVQGEMLGKIGAEMGLAAALKIGQGRSLRPAADRHNPTLLGDACEALIGAIYLDGGLDAARRVIERFWTDRVTARVAPPRHPKQLLQERIAGRKLPPPIYEVVATEGPSHAPVFTVMLKVESLVPVTATGASKRAAEQACAIAMLEQLEQVKLEQVPP